MNPSVVSIIWRDAPDAELSHFQLNTVTYGTASASFLSTHCLKQLALENIGQFPKQSNAILNDFYVDDLLTGAESASELIAIKNNLVAILNSAGFPLRKFSSNDPEILTDIITHNESTIKHLVTETRGAKTLGISWNSSSDNFEYHSKVKPLNSPITKRAVLSTISQIFDPLGLVGPIVIQGKILMQKLWLDTVSWDDPIPPHLYHIWMDFVKQITNARTLHIPRHVLLKNPTNIHLHGFCDSSIQAYGACIYLRSQNSIGDTLVSLLCAKSRVAPLKALSLPRLELSGALLLVKLTKKVISCLQLDINSIFYWSDSTIVLSWISAQPRNWKTFVCNRVSEIQSLSNINDWYHIMSSNNPADTISRGTSPNDLECSSMWWYGPSYLKQPQESWPQNSHIFSSFFRFS